MDEGIMVRTGDVQKRERILKVKNEEEKKMASILVKRSCWKESRGTEERSWVQ